MQADRLSITMDPDLDTSVRDASDLLRHDLLGAALDASPAASTPFSYKELDAAARMLGISRSERGSSA